MLAALGRYDEAVKELRIAEQLLPNASTGEQFVRARLAHTYKLAGFHESAARMVAEIEQRAETEPYGAGNLAIAYMAIGDYERMYDLLSDAAAGTIPLDLNATVEIRENVWNDPVLNEAEFLELRSRIGVWK
jgi:tetratricopeptide (TPR) repeat protein